jgi:glycosyltransferase involved in cell wall biosynthesis
MATLDEYADYSWRANVNFIENRYLPSLTGKTVMDIDRYRRVIADFRPDVIHTHLFGAELLSSAWVYAPALYVTHCHDSMVEYRRFTLRGFSKRTLTDYYERSILMWKKYRKVKPFFVTNSDDTYDYFKRMLPRRLSGRVELIPYGFQYARFFHPVRSPRAEPSPGPLVLTMVASFLWPKKNQEFLVDVAACLKARGRAFKVNLVGDGPRRGAIESYATRMGVREDMRFWGLVTNVEEVLWETDVYVHTATYEPFGLVFLEAMAAGLPCVALDGRGNRRLIRDGYNGFLVPTPDAATFAQRVIEVATDPARYAQMSRNGIAMAEGFDIRKCAEALLSFYKTKIAEARGGDASGVVQHAV